MRMPFCELVTVEDLMRTLEMMLSDWPPTKPIDRPCPPDHVPPAKAMS